MATLLFEKQSGALYIRCDNDHVFESLATWGEPPPAEVTITSDTCHALRQGKTYLINDWSKELCCQHIDMTEVTASLCVPLLTQNETLGVLHLRNGPCEEHENCQRWQQLAEMVSGQVAMALTNLALRERLQQQAIQDPLTGLYNRRYLDETLPRELQRAERHGLSMGVIMLDIDHFKHFNDTYGHDAGDTLLRAVGNFLQANTRGEDIACRYGGEEFTLVLPGASLENALQRAEQVRAGIKALTVTHLGQSLDAITVSVGVAVFPDHGTDADAVMKAADIALYRAKQGGRDQVVADQSTTGEDEEISVSARGLWQ
jgi:diguanylate cyclase (GGDEF)-like protein